MTIRNGIHFPAGTSVPSDEREKNRGAGPVKTYQLSPEELAKYQAISKPKEKNAVLIGDEFPLDNKEESMMAKFTKEDYLQRRIEGKTRTQIQSEFGWAKGTMDVTLSRWGIRRDADEAKAMQAVLAERQPVAPALPPTLRYDLATYSQLRQQGKPQPEIAQMFGMQLEDLKERVKVDREAQAAAAANEASTVNDTRTTENDPTDAKNDTTETENAAAGEPHAPTQEEREQAFEEQSPPVTAPHSSDLGETIVKSVFKAVAQSVYETAVSKGWHETPVPFPVAIALMHSELSEALEADRKQHGAEKVAEELADVIIRIMDTAEQEGLNLVDALFTKMAKNRERAWRHGGLKY